MLKVFKVRLTQVIPPCAWRVDLDHFLDSSNSLSFYMSKNILVRSKQVLNGQILTFHYCFSFFLTHVPTSFAFGPAQIILDYLAQIFWTYRRTRHKFVPIQYYCCYIASVPLRAHCLEKEWNVPNPNVSNFGIVVQ